MIAYVTSISGLILLKSTIHTDHRGFFLESFKHSSLSEHKPSIKPILQSNHSRSCPKTLREFHKESIDKLIYVVHGTALCVVADTRPDSPTFGKHETFTLGDDPGEYHRLYVPEGLSNAFYCFTEVDYINDVSGEYDPNKCGGVRWDDPTLGVDWPDKDPIISDNDRVLPGLADLYPDLCK